MLSDRRQRVLAALIEEYVARALPVGSRTLTERYQLGVSSATVRNELSVLEDGGYIAQPHTSAGRIPTDIGYRAFVDDLLSRELPKADSQRFHDAAERLRQSASEMDDLLEQTSVALTRLTDCLSIVLAPSVLDLQLKQLSLISLTPRRALIVVVTQEGQVLNRQIEFNEDVQSDDLARVQLFLNEVLSGNSLHDVERGLGKGMSQAMVDPLVRLVLDEVLSCIQEGEHGRAHSLGMSALLAQPEFSQAQAILPVMQVLEDDTVLFQILDDVVYARDSAPQVRIGSENESAQLSGVSVVASRYGRGDAAGVVAVIGPTRMDYSKVINAVRVASSALGDAN